MYDFDIISRSRFCDLDSTAEDRDILIELDGAALKAEAEAAIRSGELYNAQLGFQELNWLRVQTEKRRSNW